MVRKLFIGVDEAGYGPNLGPLIVAASVWEAPAGMCEAEFAERLSCGFAPQAWRPGAEHLPLGDSKKLYQPGGGLTSLEAGLLALQAAAHGPCRSVAELLAHSAGAAQTELQRHPWYDGFEALPVPESEQVAEALPELVLAAEGHLAKSDLRLVDTRAVIVTESQLNAGIERYQSKGQVLSVTSLRLVAEILAETRLSSEVFCDRQGGRKNYLPVLLEAMPELWFTEVSAQSERSSYRAAGETGTDIHFSVRGDSFPPTSLASMLAKYLRERLMECLNRYWRQHLPHLKATAGYPQDAKRFRREIEPVAASLGFAESAWWRCR